MVLILRTKGEHLEGLTRGMIRGGVDSGTTLAALLGLAWRGKNRMQEIGWKVNTRVNMKNYDCTFVMGAVEIGKKSCWIFKK